MDLPANAVEPGGPPVMKGSAPHVPDCPRERTDGVPDDLVTSGDETLAWLRLAVKDQGLVQFSIDANDDLMERGIPFILTQVFQPSYTVKDEKREWDSVQVSFRFLDAGVGMPYRPSYPMGEIRPLYPSEARKTGVAYVAPVYVLGSVTITARYPTGREVTKSARIPRFRIAPVPIMRGSVRCHTSKLPPAALKELGEDPLDPGGYFIVKRGEFAVHLLENIQYNSLHIHRGTGSERIRGEFISQPDGSYENSTQVVLRYMADGALTLESTSARFRRVQFPFFAIFRIYGMTSDLDIVRQVVFDPDADSPVTRHLVGVVDRALHVADKEFAPILNELDREALVGFLAERVERHRAGVTAHRDVEDAIRRMNSRFLELLDQAILPHVGIRAEDRIQKLWYLGLLYNQLLLADMGIRGVTDRDSYFNKRLHGAADSLAKSIKTSVNNGLIFPIRRSLERLVRTRPFDQITSGDIHDAFRVPLASSTLEALQRAIVVGHATYLGSRQRIIVNRMASKPLERKNMVNVYSALRSVDTHNPDRVSKQTERGDEMRRVHNTYPGYICIAHSPDSGESVGVKKQLAISAGVTTPVRTRVLRDHLLANPAVTPLEEVPVVDRRTLARVFVNGAWVGCTDDALGLADAYRALRRAGGEGCPIHPKASITWDPVADDVRFLLDGGRAIRPLLVVTNNIAAYREGCRAAFAARRAGEKDPARLRVPFAQNVLLTRTHVRGMMRGAVSLDDLVVQGIVDYVAVDEASNCLFAPSIEVLRADAADVLRRYTHCDVPQSLFGLAAHLNVYGDHTQPARGTLETNQGRQAGGWYVLSPDRYDHNRFFQYYCEVPAVRTMAQDYTLPNGSNTIAAYMVYGGWNQEDSAIVNAASVDRGLLHGVFFRVERAELERGETFGVPDPATTRNMRPNASYEKLGADGLVPVGTVVVSGDALIGRIGEARPGGDRRRRPQPGGTVPFEHVDRSIIYRNEEEAIVDASEKLRGSNDDLFAVVRLRYTRPLWVGDKISSRSGNKGIEAVRLPEIDMPFIDDARVGPDGVAIHGPLDGVRPDIILNPHSIPTRMTIGQLIESYRSILCAHQGAVADGTAFRPIDLDDIGRQLYESGYRYNGLFRLRNGFTGECYDAAIFVGGVFHQRILKFVRDERYAAGYQLSTDALTGQPQEGKIVGGGLRQGEMEVWVMAAHGSMMTLAEKLSRDSDGRTAFFCRGCGGRAIYNGRAERYSCPRCGPDADIAAVDSCRAATVFMDEMESGGINVRFQLAPRAFEEPSGAGPPLPGEGVGRVGGAAPAGAAEPPPTPAVDLALAADTAQLGVTRALRTILCGLAQGSQFARNRGKMRAEYEATNILERWIIALANSPGHQDQREAWAAVYRRSDPGEPFNVQMCVELRDKTLTNDPSSVLDEVLAAVSRGLAAGPAPLPDPEGCGRRRPFCRELCAGYGRFEARVGPGLRALIEAGSCPAAVAIALRYAVVVSRGQQWGVPFRHFRFLHDEHGVRNEGFASALNSRVVGLGLRGSKFCSLFPDLEAQFGSLGSFFGVDMLAWPGAWLVNPPYVEAIMARVADKLEAELGRAGEAGTPLTVYVLLPAWMDSPPVIRLLGSAHMVGHIRLEKGSYYFETGDRKKITANYPCVYMAFHAGPAPPTPARALATLEDIRR